MDSFSAGSVTARIIPTLHGPEIGLYHDFVEIGRFTVAEWEKFAGNAGTLGRTARSQLSAKTRLQNLPMRLRISD